MYRVCKKKLHDYKLWTPVTVVVYFFVVGVLITIRSVVNDRAYPKYLVIGTEDCVSNHPRAIVMQMNSSFVEVKLREEVK
jgi:hypothetical protein